MKFYNVYMYAYTIYVNVCNNNNQSKGGTREAAERTERGECDVILSFFLKTYF